MHTTPAAYSTAELEDILKKLDQEDAIGKGDTFHLLDEVRFSDLRKMNDANLQGRLDYYLREFTFEMNPRFRREFHREVVRSRIELRRRVLENRRKAIEDALKPVDDLILDTPFMREARKAA